MVAVSLLAAGVNAPSVTKYPRKDVLPGAHLIKRLIFNASATTDPPPLASEAVNKIPPGVRQIGVSVIPRLKGRLSVIALGGVLEYKYTANPLMPLGTAVILKIISIVLINTNPPPPLGPIFCNSNILPYTSLAV
jgi:hypothetical protein